MTDAIASLYDIAITDDQQAMALALQQAEHGLFTTTPNPRVGCVIVSQGRVIGAGYTQPPGGNHAEIQALQDAAARGHDVRGATAYVTLEPCSHFGRTPPCADALIKAGLATVVAAMTDPNPLVAGQGMARLQAAGINVRAGILSEQAQEMNIGFFSNQPPAWTAKPPCTTAKANGSPALPRATTVISGAPAPAPSSPASAPSRTTTPSSMCVPSPPRANRAAS